MPTPRTLLIGLGALASLALGVGLNLAQASPSLSACLAECKRGNMSMTNRATCRLDCEVDAASDPEQIRARIAPLAPRPTAPAPGPIASAEPAAGPGCKAACDADGTLSVDDRATCRLECDLVPDPMPTGTPPPMRPPRTSAPPSSTPPSSAPRPAPLAPGRVATSAPAPSQAGFLARCHATCKPGASEREATDYETCKLDCDTMASVLDVAVVMVPDAWLAAPRPIATRDPTPVPAAPSTPTPTRVAAPAPVGEDCGAALDRCNASCAKVEGTCARKCGRKHVIETDRETCKLGCGTDQEVCQGDCLSASATCVNSRNPRRGG